MTRVFRRTRRWLPVTVLAASLLWCATPRAQQDPPPPTQTFPDWLLGLRDEAIAKGVHPATLDLALTGLAPDPTVIVRDRAQPDQVQTLDAYLSARLTPKAATAAQAAAVAQKPLLARIELSYGVPAPIMVAIWGIESSYGQSTGTHPVITALASLAYDQRRPALFRAELIQALIALDHGLVSLPDLKGSWAGAMGQPQFMPSSFLKYAVDFDGDGKPNIWSSTPDVLASMANYLKSSGWIEGQNWGREVAVSADVLARINAAVPLKTAGCRARKESTETRTLDDWLALGVTALDGSPLAAGTATASLVRGEQRYFLTFHNYEAILEYNCSNAYALNVGLLADQIAPK